MMMCLNYHAAMLELSPTTVAILTGPLVPFLVGLVVKSTADARVKRIVNVIASLLVAIVAGAVVPETGTAVFSWQSLANIVITLIVSAQSYDQFWKPLVDPNPKLLGQKGIG